ncbi:tetratricopeptide repeat protein [Kitasatospora sp. NPDC101801]|uniref:tetratricopeptide repeat protein n=1 Tax=Kitasatospora sp. NPDC101801 TaxID=3364103 RepID=UPI0037FFBCEF
MLGVLRNRGKKRAHDVSQRLYDEGHQFAEQERWAEAERCFREAVQVADRGLGAESGSALICRTAWASALRRLGRVDEALSELRELTVQCPAVLGETHENTAEARIQLANMLIGRGRPAEADALLALVLRHRPAPDEYGLEAWEARLRALAILGRHREAVDGSWALQEQTARIYGATALGTLKVVSERVQNLICIGEYEQAECECRALLEVHDTPSLLWLSVMNALVLALTHLGRHDEAEAAARRALLREQDVAQPSNDLRIALTLGLSRALSGAGRHEEGLQAAARAEEDHRNDPTPRLTLAAPVATVTAQALLGLGRNDEAETRSRKAIDLAQPLGPTHHSTLEAATTLGRVLAAQHRHTEARDHLTRCTAAWREHFGPDHPRTRAAETVLAALPPA